jgi:DNA-binding beta-propeller fold protein YncE
LGKLEQSFPDELTVVGVQSPKYPAEGTGDSLIRAVERYDIEHPVVNDPEYRVWDNYAVKAWPTLVFVSPTGTVIGSHAGEVPFESLREVVQNAIGEYTREGSLSPRAGPEGQRFVRTFDQLSFPGKVLAIEDRLFIADSGHNRVLECDLDGNVRTIIGSGEPGLRDGDVAAARFSRPQGMALDVSTGTLYVADESNHVIRAVDRRAGTVSTVAGTGEQALRVIREGPATGTPLSSPWDLALSDGVLYVAMAGLHQVWALSLDSNTIAVWAGTGHEGLRDGPRTTAWLAQPMGLTADERSVYVACAEAQAIRAVKVASGDVHTLSGQGLFNFGDEDGPGSAALMQHPQGVTYCQGALFVADTYNHKIKRIDLDGATVTTAAGSGQEGVLDGPGAHARLNEPAGISGLGDALYIADTNNHLIRRLDLDSGHINTIRVSGLGETAHT